MPTTSSSPESTALFNLLWIVTLETLLTVVSTMISAYGIEEVYYRDTYERDEQAKEIFDWYNIKLVRLE